MPRTEKEYFLKNTVGGGGRYKTLNKFRSAGRFDGTKVPGKKPLLVHLSDDGAAWVLADKTVITSPLRVVELTECGSFGCLLEQYGHCLVTEKSVPVSAAPKPIFCKGTASLGSVFEYLGLVTPGKKDGRMVIQVNAKTHSYYALLMKNPPTWSLMGTNDDGFLLYEFHAPASKGIDLTTRLNATSSGLTNAIRSAPADSAAGLVGLSGASANVVVSAVATGQSISYQASNMNTIKTFSWDKKWILF